MLRYFYLIKDLFLINPTLILKPLFCSFIIIVCLWNFIIKRPLYQRIYGKPDPTHLEISQKDDFIDMEEHPIIPIEIKGYEIEIQPIKKFKTTARVTYVDRYNAIGSWYRSSKAAKLYDAIVPQDISLATGKIGRNYNCFKFTHEYRMGGGFSKYKCNNKWWEEFPLYITEISNNHTIAYNTNIQKGIDILKPGEVAHLEGYLIYWNGTKELDYVRFESAVTEGQISKYIVDGAYQPLCRQLLLTKLTFDGYTFE